MSGAVFCPDCAGALVAGHVCDPAAVAFVRAEVAELLAELEALGALL